MLLHFLEEKWNWSSSAVYFTLPSFKFLVNGSQQGRIVSKPTCPPNNFITSFILVLQLLVMTIFSLLLSVAFLIHSEISTMLLSGPNILYNFMLPFSFVFTMPAIRCALLELCILFQISTRIITSCLATYCINIYIYI